MFFQQLLMFDRILLLSFLATISLSKFEKKKLLVNINLKKIPNLEEVRRN